MDGPPNEGGELQSIHNNHDEYFTFSGHDDEYVERFTTLQFGGDCWVGLYTYLRTTTDAFIVIFSICGCRIRGLSSHSDDLFLIRIHFKNAIL